MKTACLRPLAAHHIAVLEEGTHRRTFEDHLDRITVMLPTVLDVYQAQRRIGNRLPKTPLLPSPWLSSIADGNVFLKIESANLTSSFKIRGAFNAALRLSEGVDSDDATDRDGVCGQSRARAGDGHRAARPVVRGVHAGLRAGDQEERDPAPRRQSSFRLRGLRRRREGRRRRSRTPKAASTSRPTTIRM